MHSEIINEKKLIKHIYIGISVAYQSMLYNRLVVLRSIGVSDLSGENSKNRLVYTLTKKNDREMS